VKRIRKIAACSILLLCLYAAGAAAAVFVEDFNGDGKTNVLDVICLLVAGRKNPADTRLDYDGNGRYSLADAVALLTAICSGKLTPVEEPAADSWRVVGPGGGGAMFIPTVDPFDSGHVLLACDMTGAYVTNDDGVSWRMINLRTVVNDFEFDPTRQGTVYACNTGLWRSADGGLNWSLVYPPPAEVIEEHMVGDHAEQYFRTAAGRKPEAEIDKVRVDPADGNRIFIGVGSWWNGPAEIMASSDGGASWSVLSGVPGANVLAIFPGSWWQAPDEVIAVTDQAIVRISQTTGDTTLLAPPDSALTGADGGFSDSTGAVLYVMSSLRQYGANFFGGPFRSLDGGKSWTQIVTSLTATALTPSYNTFAVCQGRPATVYLSCDAYPNNVIGILRTTDSGNTWSWVLKSDWTRIITNNFAESWLIRNLGLGYGGSPNGLGVCPSDPEVCFAACGNTFRTRNGGATWQTVYSNDRGGSAYSSRGLDVTTCYGVHFDPFDSLHVFITYTDIGLFQSYDGGESWVQSLQGISGGVRNTCYWLEFDPAVKGRIWSVWSNWHDLPRMKMFNANWPNAQGIPATSADGGKTWVGQNWGAPGDAPYTHILIDPASPSDSRTLYACAFGKGVYKSVNGGVRWDAASSGIGSNKSAWRITRASDGTLYLVVVRNGTESNVIPGALYRSTDGAATWEALALPEGATGPNDLALDPVDQKIMYLACWPRTDRSVDPRVEHGGGLYRTTDGGATWKQVFYDDAHVYATAIDPDRPETIYINTFDSAAFRSLDRGEHWYRLKGYNFKWGHRPILDPNHKGMIYLTSFGGSVFYGPVTGVAGAKENFSEDYFMRWERKGF